MGFGVPIGYDSKADIEDRAMLCDYGLRLFTALIAYARDFMAKELKTYTVKVNGDSKVSFSFFVTSTSE